jgi:hypothetical protein
LLRETEHGFSRPKEKITARLDFVKKSYPEKTVTQKLTISVI